MGIVLGTLPKNVSSFLCLRNQSGNINTQPSPLPQLWTQNLFIFLSFVATGTGHNQQQQQQQQTRGTVTAAASVSSSRQQGSALLLLAPLLIKQQQQLRTQDYTLLSVGAALSAALLAVAEGTRAYHAGFSVHWGGGY
jgi:hypothetical protein